MKTRLLIIFTGIIVLSLIIVADNFETKFAYAMCAASLSGPPGPCFDSFSVSDSPLTARSIMENFARNIELNYGDWQMSDRKWDNEDVTLQLPVIICTEFVADGIKQYRMVRWVDLHTISSFENHSDDSLCDKWLAPIDDGVKIRWDKPTYLPNDVGIVKVIDKDMNQDGKKIDSFDIHVWSDIDHDGIELTVTEINIDSGIFEASVFFTATDESRGTRLLVEDAVYAEHKSSVNSSRITESEEPYTDSLCPPGKVFDWDICVNECPIGKIASNGVCHSFEDAEITTDMGKFSLVPIFIIAGVSIVFVLAFVVWRKRK